MGDKSFSTFATQLTTAAQVANNDVLGLDDITAVDTVGLPIGVLVAKVLNSKTLPSGVVVGTTDTQTLTNKTIDGDAPNTFTNIPSTALKSVTATATQLNYTTATPGTPTASKAIIADANVNVGALKATSLSTGVTGSETLISATATALNKVAGVASQIEGSDERIGQLYGGSLTTSNTILTGSAYLRCNSAGGAFQIDLPEIDKLKIYRVHIAVETGGNNITIVVNGSDRGMIKGDLTTKWTTSAILDAAGDYIVLESSGCETFYWSIIAGHGITGS